MHYSTNSFLGLKYFTMERFLRTSTDGLIFESEFIAESYKNKVGSLSISSVVIHNGLHPSEFKTPALAKDCSNFVCIAELRKFKGIEVLVQAVSIVQASRLP